MWPTGLLGLFGRRQPYAGLATRLPDERRAEAGVARRIGEQKTLGKRLLLVELESRSEFRSVADPAIADDATSPFGQDAIAQARPLSIFATPVPTFLRGDRGRVDDAISEIVSACRADGDALAVEGLRILPGTVGLRIDRHQITPRSGSRRCADARIRRPAPEEPCRPARPQGARRTRRPSDRRGSHGARERA